VRLERVLFLDEHLSLHRIPASGKAHCPNESCFCFLETDSSRFQFNASEQINELKPKGEPSRPQE
jgi:hypothetical protein